MPARLTQEASERYTRRVPSPKRITSAVYAVYVVAASAFIISSTAQIAVAVFAEPAPEGSSKAPSEAVAPACAAGVRTLASAVDRGVAAAGAAADPAEAAKKYRAARSPEWDEAQQRELVAPCAGNARGADAVAAVGRLDRAAEGAIRRQTDELAPVRRAVDSFIR
jgi:hypothetical protein